MTGSDGRAAGPAVPGSTPSRSFVAKAHDDVVSMTWGCVARHNSSTPERFRP